jgi:DNA-binding HxlR family transcriptional regulator
LKCEKVTKCRLESIVDIIGSKWNLMIIWHLRTCTLRFSELQSRMCGINSKTITKHLRDLEQESIITRTVYPEVPPRVEYTLTEQGREILPIIDEMLIWGGKFRHPSEELCRSETDIAVSSVE